MPSLERFFDPQIRKFDLNIRSLPGARFYFFENGTTTPKTIYQDKAGTIPHTNPVIADSSGSFAPIFLDGLYRVELRSNANIVQPGWPIDNVGQDSAVVPFGPWVEILPYNTGEVVTGSNGNWYRSLEDNNLGNNPVSSPSKWEVIPIPVASSFTSNKAYFTWSDDGDQISLDLDVDALGADVADSVKDEIAEPGSDLVVGGEITAINLPKIALRTTGKTITSSTTLQDDADLTITGLDSAAYYKISLYLNWFNGASSGNGIKLQVSGNAISIDGIFLANTNATTANSAPTANTSDVVFEKMPNSASPTTNYILYDAIMIGNTSVKVQWAQAASNIVGTTVGRSVLIAQKLS